MRSVMSHDFSRVPAAEIQRSTFQRDHGYKTTFDAGYLIPVFVEEVLPGDTFNLRLTSFGRLATPLAPLMDNLRIESFFFFVPNRLTWNNWQKFNGEQENPGDSTSYVIPQVNAPGAGWPQGSLADYFGLPTKVGGFSVSALPFRAHNLIWNEWFRDENLQNSKSVPKGDGPDLESLFGLYRRGKRYDYFTSCLPWPQKGPSVPLPLGTSAPVVAKSPVTGNAWVARYATSGSAVASATGFTTNGAGAVIAQPGGLATIMDPSDTLRVDLSAATAATINSLRQAFQIQKLYERDARGGTRYTEIVRSHFGVISPDARLQRPEFLGGGSSKIIINPVTQTSANASQPTPQGNVSGIGVFSQDEHGFTKSFTEHGYVLGYVSVRADLNYQQGIDRHWKRSGRFDFYWPALSHIGEQAVRNDEILCQGSAEVDAATFGYQERWAEYRYKQSRVTSLMRSNATGTLDMWHLAQNFASLPALNSSFIEENPPMDRILAVPTQPDFIFDGYFDFNCTRPMPTYSVPGLIDHF